MLLMVCFLLASNLQTSRPCHHHPSVIQILCYSKHSATVPPPPPPAVSKSSLILTAVVRLRVRHKDVVQPSAGRLQLLLERRHVGPSELLVRCIHQRCLVVSINDVRVVRCAVLQAKFYVKPVPIPVQAAKGERVFGHRGGDDLQPLVAVP